MELSSAGNLDELTQLPDLSLSTLIALVQRLQATESSEHYLFRELELDQAFFWAEENVKSARTAGKAVREEMHHIRDLVLAAHDFVGTNNVHAAIAELNKVIELKMGLASEA
jgi:hypothetical protein